MSTLSPILRGSGKCLYLKGNYYWSDRILHFHDYGRKGRFLYPLQSRSLRIYLEDIWIKYNWGWQLCDHHLQIGKKVTTSIWHINTKSHNIWSMCCNFPNVLRNLVVAPSLPTMKGYFVDTPSSKLLPSNHIISPPVSYLNSTRTSMVKHKNCQISTQVQRRANCGHVWGEFLSDRFCPKKTELSNQPATVDYQPYGDDILPYSNWEDDGWLNTTTLHAIKYQTSWVLRYHMSRKTIFDTNRWSLLLEHQAWKAEHSVLLGNWQTKILRVKFSSWWLNHSQTGSFPQIGVNIQNIWNHHLVLFIEKMRDIPSTVSACPFFGPFFWVWKHNPRCELSQWAVNCTLAVCFPNKATLFPSVEDWKKRRAISSLLLMAEIPNNHLGCMKPYK